jgi:photosystem II stability/assembly factor-like uncharacterized protein
MNVAIIRKSHLAQTLLTVIFICFIVSCSKEDTPDPDPDPNPPPATKPDTLSAGWTKIKATPDSLAIVDIFFGDYTTGYLLSMNNFSVYKTTNSGINWSKLDNRFSNGTNLFVTPDGKLFVPTLTGQIYRSADGGENIESITTPGSEINDVYFVDNNVGFATSIGGLLKTIDGGVNWTLTTPLTGLAMQHGQYSSLYFTDSSTGWLCSGNSLFKSDGNMHTWQNSNLSTTGSEAFSIYAASPTVIYAGNLDGKLFKSTNGGIDYTVVKTFISDKPIYLDTHFFDENNGYVCYGKKIYKTTDGGNSWLTVATLVNENLIEIHFTDATHGWACTDKGNILKYN